MDRDRFWEIVTEAANFMIDKHKELTATDGQDAADESFAEALSASNMMTALSGKCTLEDRLSFAIQHCAFAITALWLDMESVDVSDVTLVLRHNTDEQGHGLN